MSEQYLDEKIKNINEFLKNNKYKDKFEIGKIYSLSGYGLNYVGKTTTSIDLRLNSHYSNVVDNFFNNDKEGIGCKSFYILLNGFDVNVKILDIVLVTNKDETELKKLEKKYINENKCINNVEFYPDNLINSMKQGITNSYIFNFIKNFENENENEDEIEKLKPKIKNIIRKYIKNIKYSDIGIIYKIFNENDTYYGSTTSKLEYRIKGHYRNRNGKKKCASHIIVNDIYDYSLCEIIFLQDRTNKKPLLELEAKHIKENKCINEIKPFKTEEEKKEYYNNWYEENKERVAEWGKQYRENHKERITERGKQYRENHKQRIAEYQKLKYERNKNKSEFQEKIKQDIKCTCGMTLRKNKLSRHVKTDYHNRWNNVKEIPNGYKQCETCSLILTKDSFRKHNCITKDL